MCTCHSSAIKNFLNTVFHKGDQFLDRRNYTSHCPYERVLGIISYYLETRITDLQMQPVLGYPLAIMAMISSN